MSAVLNKFQQAQQDVMQRLRELEPLVQEYEELRRIAERLQLAPDGSFAGEARQPISTTPARRATAGGGRRQDILRLVAERPGMTINQIGKELRVDPTGLYRSVRGLVADGQISKRGPNLYPSEIPSLRPVTVRSTASTADAA